MEIGGTTILGNTQMDLEHSYKWPKMGHFGLSPLEVELYNPTEITGGSILLSLPTSFLVAKGKCYPCCFGHIFVKLKFGVFYCTCVGCFAGCTVHFVLNHGYLGTGCFLRNSIEASRKKRGSRYEKRLWTSSVASSNKHNTKRPWKFHMDPQYRG